MLKQKKKTKNSEKSKRYIILVLHQKLSQKFLIKDVIYHLFKIKFTREQPFHHYYLIGFYYLFA